MILYYLMGVITFVVTIHLVYSWAARDEDYDEDSPFMWAAYLVFGVIAGVFWPYALAGAGICFGLSWISRASKRRGSSR